MSGKTQGETKDIKPAKKAERIEMFNIAYLL